MKNSIFADGAGYVRGRFVPIAEATLPVTDWGFTRSDVVYDVVHVFKGGFFRLADHLDRFERSMAKRRIRPPEDRAAIETILHRCVALTGLIDAYVAMVASRGRPRVAGSRRPADCENHLIAYALPWIDVIPKDVQARGSFSRASRWCPICSRQSREIACIEAQSTRLKGGRVFRARFGALQ